ncbi:MAG: pilus assembly protein TadG-related protein [Candidatus Omnitrophica bacterium]|nr:pilus assembly protein TadG-related protein [Candidatus Omnitrophota bacterium]
MFSWFAGNKANYEKGQVFPFIIAIVVIIVIMAMVTANLGKLAIFKTDVSNAADSASLSSVSGLSAFLLGLGLESDNLWGNCSIRLMRMCMIFSTGFDPHIPGFSLTDILGTGSSANDGGSGGYIKFPTDLAASLMLYITYVIAYIFAYIKANWNGEITWASAKQSALASAFNNSGVDERNNPDKKFKTYIGKDPNQAYRYDEYLNTYMNQQWNETGFARFMQHPVTGFGSPIGEIEPGSGSPGVCVSGFGWKQNDDETFVDSFVDGGAYNDTNTYPNYVEVRVEGASSYPIKALLCVEKFPYVSAIVTGLTVLAYAKYEAAGLCATPPQKILCAIWTAIDVATMAVISTTIPVGYTFPGRDMDKYTTDNPIKVKVTRHKNNTNLGMWNFQYGDVSAQSWGHTFVQGGSTIEPLGGWMNFNFNTEEHLFETEIVAGSVR